MVEKRQRSAARVDEGWDFWWAVPDVRAGIGDGAGLHDAGKDDLRSCGIRSSDAAMNLAQDVKLNDVAKVQANTIAEFASATVLLRRRV